ncbi:MAG: patatin-like phospholipase family protein [Brevundimonas sp.]|uniref:patatin-like phospholipase family protein n=1 Tax=Brevundimonas sp. TaxID=1871086 RepID=UPI0024873F8B|nr:patatin-like phospholipase family protein [Brevundimonas sp.]MDI1328280.1 patatin-like phospholipase family protein [Brevundimonas sp.]
MTEPDARAAPPLEPYAPEDFSVPDKVCDLVMKGGVTSGVVYPYAVLELARVYRFKSIGGTSAGAIAAAFAAAAEYARTVGNDPAGFVRLQRWCDALPDILPTLFQPSPRYAPLMDYLLRGQAGTGGLRWLWNLPRVFWGTSLAGTIGGVLAMLLLGAGLAGAVLGGVVGFLVAIVVRMIGFASALASDDFGMCPGIRQPGHEGPALVDWLHAALQDIAFGAEPGDRILTFGDLEGPDETRPVIDLEMITTNLSQHRPHSLPRIEAVMAFLADDWARLFPQPVLNFMAARAGRHGRNPALEKFPSARDLPVIVAVRMSLSFPFLFRAVPMRFWNVEKASLMALLAPAPRSAAAPARANVPWDPVLFTDGGLSSNFPIHMFDTLLPARPTFALSLEALPKGMPLNGPRVLIPKTAGDGLGLAVAEVRSAPAFAMGLLGSAKDWQDALLSVMPGQRERIARVYLSPDEGGLNLSMPKARSLALMGYGKAVGAGFAGGALNFDEHRWRRALVAYDQLEDAVRSLDAVWTEGGFDAFLAAYDKPLSYKKAAGDRDRIHQRLGAVADLWTTVFQPPVAAKDKKMPRPEGRLRIGPDV